MLVVGANFIRVAVCLVCLVRTAVTKNEEKAKEWLKEYNEEAEKLMAERAEASWNYSVNITDHNRKISQKASAKKAVFDKEKCKEADEFDWRSFTDPLLKREFSKIVDIGGARLSDDDHLKVTKMMSEMKTIYSTAKVCNRPGDLSEKCYPLDPDLTEIMAKSNDANVLLWAWKGWRDVSGKKMGDIYEEFVQLQNKAAKLNGYKDAGDYWRSWYESETFLEDCEALWQELKPLYEQLHAYTRRKLKEKYDNLDFPTQGHIPAHLLGNMWAQSWDNVEEILRPSSDTPGVDVTSEMIKQNYTALRIFKMAENFFKSLGLKKMKPSFWEKSMMVKPEDREVVCHASAGDLYNRKDFLIKQCTEVNMHWLLTTYHEMGHIEYYIHYCHQPVKFRRGANPGFHETIGDVASLSVSTPEYLKSVGLLPDFVDDPNGDLNFLMKQALRKVTFLPFGYLIDQWRWDIFSGKTNKSNYNSNWWELRCKYQGISPPVERTEEDFDAGSKFHVPNNVPYIRYFVAHVITFQIHEALCKAANNEKPLHRCEISNSKEAGKILAEVMELGSSKPWPEVLKKATGSNKMLASSLLKYYQPLHDWLKKQNEGHPIGWEEKCP